MQKKVSTPQIQSPQQPFVERRRFPRLNINVGIKYSVIPKADQSNVNSKNISTGGICLIAQDELKVGDRLKLEISLPDDPSLVRAIGHVVWVKSFSMAQEKSQRFDAGVEFIEINNEAKEKIQRYIFRLT